VDAFLLQLLSSLNTFPGGGELDEDALATDAGLLVGGDDFVSGLDRLLRVIGEARIDFRGNTARYDLQNALAEFDGELLEGEVGDLLLVGTFAELSAPSTMSEYSGICAAVAMSDGLVVASCGLNSLMALKSPVSETTVVMLRSCSSTTSFAMIELPYPSHSINLSGCLFVKMRRLAVRGKGAFGAFCRVS